MSIATAYVFVAWLADAVVDAHYTNSLIFHFHGKPTVLSARLKILHSVQSTFEHTILTNMNALFGLLYSV